MTIYLLIRNVVIHAGYMYIQPVSISKLTISHQCPDHPIRVYSAIITNIRHTCTEHKLNYQFRFILQACIQLTETDSLDIYNVTKDSRKKYILENH